MVVLHGLWSSIHKDKLGLMLELYSRPMEPHEIEADEKRKSRHKEVHTSYEDLRASEQKRGVLDIMEPLIAYWEPENPLGFNEDDEPNASVVVLASIVILALLNALPAKGFTPVGAHYDFGFVASVSAVVLLFCLYVIIDHVNNSKKNGR